MKIKTRSLLINITLIAISFQNINAQKADKDARDKLSRHEKKELIKQQKKATNQAGFEKAKAALKNDDWALEANRLYQKRGGAISVSEQTNFISREDNTVYIQFTSNSNLIGNGIGGFTLKGKPTKTELTEDKHGNITCKMTVIGTKLTAQITVRLTNGNIYADAEVDAITSNSRLSFSGKIVPLEESKIYRSGMDL